MPDKFISRSNRRRATLFITCMVISMLTWLFYTLSGTYDYEADTAVRYVNVPVNKAFHPLQPDTVSLRIQGTGWQLLFDKMRIKPVTIDADMKKLGSGNYIIFSQQLTELNKQVKSVQRIVSVRPDTLFFDFSSRSVKKVPVRLIHDLEFKKQFGISSPVRIEPANITITGPATELAAIRYWPTDSLRMKDIHKTFKVKVRLSENSSPNIEIFPPVVTANIPVDEFTEKMMEIPLRLTNRNSHAVKLLPATVKVKVLASLTGFHKAEWDKLIAVVDLNSWSYKRYSQLPVRLLNVPAFSSVITVDPQAIDFIVSK